MIMVDDLVLRQ